MTVLPLVGVVACADVWGFSDLTEAPDAVARDATAAEEAAVGGAEGGTDSGPDGSLEGDGPSGERPDAQDETGEAGKAGEAGRIPEGGTKDAPDDGAIAYCKANCLAGCCDSAGNCLTALSPRACGTAGATCVDCTTTETTCTALTPACCGSTTRQCGCSLATVGCSKN
jgi:hypothetical protein